MLGSSKKGVGDFPVFVLIAVSIIFILLVAGGIGKILAELETHSRLKGVVEVYMNLDDKGTEFSFLATKKGEWDFMEILGMVGSGMEPRKLESQLKSMEDSLNRIKDMDNREYYIAVINSSGDVIYEKKSEKPPIFVGMGIEDIEIGWPLSPTNDDIVSGFGWRKLRGEDNFHGGIDIKGVIGDPVFSATDGKVYDVGRGEMLGKYVVVEYVSPRTKIKYHIRYGHLNSFSVRKGHVVKKGDKIGEVGETGYTEGPHLHFELMRDADGDGTYAPDEESVNLCPYLEDPKEIGKVDPKKCMKRCTVYYDSSICETATEVVRNRFDIPLLGRDKGSVELVLW